MRLFICFLLSVAFLGNMEAQEFKYPYFYIKGTKIDDLKGSYGYYYNREDIKNQKLHIDLDVWKNNLIDQMTNLPKGKQNLLIYIHGLWADNELSFKGILKKMDEHVYTHINNPYGLTVSLRWQGAIHYDQNVELTIKKGEIFAKVYQELENEIHCRFPDAKISFLCHSMGNRVLQSMIDVFRTENYNPRIEVLVMAAPDIDEDILFEGKELSDICHFAKDILVYHHPHDTTLGFSTQLNQKLRLGKVEKVDTTLLVCKRINFRNLIEVDDNEDLSGKITNHRYFYSSPTVRKQILERLSR